MVVKITTAQVVVVVAAAIVVLVVVVAVTGCLLKFIVIIKPSIVDAFAR